MMPKNLWLQFPEEIMFFIANEVEQLVYDIAAKFELSGDQEMYIFDLADDIFLKKISILDLPNYLDKIPQAKGVDVRLLALDLAYKVFWPLQDYLGGVDRLILRLGGKVPRQKTLQAGSKDDNKLFNGTEQSTVSKMLERYKNFASLRLTANKIVNKAGHIVPPIVANWIEDYVHFLGAGNHNSLERAQYLSKAANALKVSEKERERLRYFFVSYDENSLVFFHLDQGILMVEEIQEQEKTPVAENASIDISQTLDNFYQNLRSLDNKIVSANIIMSEAENNPNKVRDILWQAMGIGDKDKALGCLRVLITKKSFDQMIKEDSRFKNILKRFIGVKYGQNMERALDENIDQLIVRRIFLEMILSEKLRLSEEDAYSTAFYLTNIIPGSGQVVYLDKRSKAFRWLEIQV